MDIDMSRRNSSSRDMEFRRRVLHLPVGISGRLVMIEDEGDVMEVRIIQYIGFKVKVWRDLLIYDDADVWVLVHRCP